MKATDQYFPGVLFIMLYKVVLTIDSAVDEIPKCDLSDEICWAVLSCGTVFLMLHKVLLTFYSVDKVL